MATTRKRTLVSFSTEEMDHVDGFARQVRLSRSELLRRLVLGQRLPDPARFERAEAIRDLLKVNADQARLGNLLKLVLAEGDGPLTRPEIDQIKALIEEARDTQTRIKALVVEIDKDRAPGRRASS